MDCTVDSVPGNYFVGVETYVAENGLYRYHAYVNLGYRPPESGAEHNPGHIHSRNEEC